VKKGIKPLSIGVLVLVIGIALIPLIVLKVIKSTPEPQQFLVPGKVEVSVSEPGKYYLWNDHQTFYEGKFYNSGDTLPNVEFYVTDETGKRLSVKKDASTTIDLGETSKKSIGYIDVENSEMLTIGVEGEFNERVFSFSENHALRIIGAIMGGFVCAGILLFVGLALVIWGVIALVLSSKKVVS